MTAIAILYFAVISMYVIAPNVSDILPYDSIVWDVIYWINNTIFTTSLAFTASLLSYDKKLKILLLNTAIFLLILGIFQTINTLTKINDCVWIIISTISILTILISHKYVSSRVYEK